VSIVAYKNKNTGQVVAYPTPDARLEALDEWERAEASEVTFSVADAHDRAAAERASIEAAAAIRLDTAAGAAALGIAGAKAANEAAGGSGQPGPLPTLSTGDAGERQQLVSLLDKGNDARAAATTSFEENKRLADEEILHPPADGVLARAKRDHKTGATQIGENPQEHAGPRAAAAAGHSGGHGGHGGHHGGTGSDAGTVGGDTAGTTSTGTTSTGTTSTEVKRPADSAGKSDWVDYAVYRGADRGEASGKTKPQLQEQYPA
jgi:hypothetical protein